MKLNVCVGIYIYDTIKLYKTHFGSLNQFCLIASVLPWLSPQLDHVRPIIELFCSESLVNQC